MSREAVYRTIVRLYGFPPQVIAEMTREQQYMLISEPETGVKEFATFSEYQQWKRANVLGT